MTTAVIGEFAPPHDAVTLYNHHLLDELCVREPVRHCDIAALCADGVVEFGRRVRRLVSGADRLMYLTRCWDRPSLLHLLIALRIARRRVDRIDLVVHTELFAFFGPMRSRHVGWPLLKMCFAMADSITCADEATAKAVRQFTKPGALVAIEPMNVPAPIRHEATTQISTDAHPMIVVSCSEESIALIEDAHQLAAGLFLRTGQRPLVVALTYGEVEVNDHRVSAWVQNPSAGAVKHWVANAIAFIRPVRSMGSCPLPKDWFVLERPEVRGELALDTGTVVLRRPLGDREDPDLVDQVVADAARGPSRSVLLIGVFDGDECEESRINGCVKAGLEHEGFVVRTIGLPTDGFDGETVKSFREFLRRMRNEVRTPDTVICLTQGYTRPSLLLLLAVALRVRRTEARLLIVFHRDLFDFWSKLRSRNAGLPLLFTTFSIAERVYTSAPGRTVAMQYRDQPDKFVSVSYPTGGVADAVDAGTIDLRDSDLLASWFADYRRLSTTSITTGSARRLTCDGLAVGVDDAACVDLYDGGHDVVDRLVLIRKGTTDVAEMVWTMSAALAASTDSVSPELHHHPVERITEKRN